MTKKITIKEKQINKSPTIVSNLRHIYIEKLYSKDKPCRNDLLIVFKQLQYFMDIQNN